MTHDDRRRSRATARRVLRAAMAVALMGAGLIGTARPAVSAATASASVSAESVDISLVVSVDISQSVDDNRFRLQMNGIASAFEDRAVVATITSGPHYAILVSLIAWADKSEIAIPWGRISSKAEAAAVTERLRALPRYTGVFTCMARMFRFLRESVLPDLPVSAGRVVVDVSGDGVGNCSATEATAETRDALVAAGVTINGLPILEDPERIVGNGAYRAPGCGMQYVQPPESREQLNLEGWYTKCVMGGEHAFVLPANGCEDFDRAIRQKFVTETSEAPRTPPPLVVMPRAGKTGATRSQG